MFFPMDSFFHLAIFIDSMSGGEIMIVFIAILMLFGSKNVPNIARTIGKSIETFRKASRGITDEIMRADIQDEPPPARLKKSEPPPPRETPAIAVDEPEATVQIKPSVNSVERNEKPS